MGAMTFKQTLTAWSLGRGAGAANIERDGAGRPIALWPIHPTRIETKRDDAGDIVHDVRSEDIVSGHPPIRIPNRDMLYVHGLGETGITGYPMSTLAREAIGLGLASEKFAADFFDKGAVPLTVIMYPAKMQKTAIKNFRQKWGEKVRANRHEPALLHEGMDIKQLSINPVDAQMIEAGHFTIEDMARWFRIPPHKIQHLLRSTFSNITEQNLEYVIDCLDSWATLWQEEIMRKMFTAEERETYYVEFLFDKLLRGDPLKRANVQFKYWQMGALSADDINEMENRNPLPDGLGDKYYVPMNVKEVGEPEPEPPEETDAGTGFENEEPSNTEENQEKLQELKEALADAIEPVVKVENRGLLRADGNHTKARAVLESKREYFKHRIHSSDVFDLTNNKYGWSLDFVSVIEDYSHSRIESKLQGQVNNAKIDPREVAEAEADALIEKLLEVL
jgi:HK97 family phage portal protein